MIFPIYNDAYEYHSCRIIHKFDKSLPCLTPQQKWTPTTLSLYSGFGPPQRTKRPMTNTTAIDCLPAEEPLWFSKS